MQAETSYKTSIFVVICGPEWDIDGCRLWDMGPHYLGQSELRWDSHIKWDLHIKMSEDELL